MICYVHPGMDEEWSAENVDEKNEKKIKRKSKKDKKKKESSREQEAPNSEKEGIDDMETDHIKRQDKKKHKGKKDDEIDNKKGSREGELADVDGENNSSQPTLDSAERKRKKREKKMNKNEKFENTETEEVDATEMVEKKKKKKNEKKSTGDDAIGPQDTYSEAKYDEGDVQSIKEDAHATERKKKKKPKRQETDKDVSADEQDSVGNGSNIQNGEIENANKKKKRKTKSVENGPDERQDNEVQHANKGKKRKTMLVGDGPSDATPNKSNKKVRFSGEDEVFTLPNDSDAEDGNGEDNLAGSSNAEKGNGEDNLLRGKRFTSAENEIVKQAVLNYIEKHELGDEGLDMILNSRKHTNMKGCWKEIASAIPYRPYRSVYARARILFMRSESRKWTQEEKDAVLAYHEVHGNNWKLLAGVLGKHRWHVKDTYRRIKLTNLKKGKWSQEECQKLFDLVNTDLQLKLSEEKKSKHGMLRDNICWSAISDELSTRNVATCCMKWYRQLTSPMVADGVWADSDDYRLLSALYSLDATCMEDVDWDDLVENRSGDVCRKRWNQMVLHIGHYGRKSFAERVEVLAQRYCPNLLEAREIWDSKPRVP